MGKGCQNEAALDHSPIPVDFFMALPESSYRFKFQAQELPEKLSQLSQEMLTGYWLFEFPDFDRIHEMHSWYLAFFQGRVVFSGNQQISWTALLKIFQRYVPRLQNAPVRNAILTLEQQFIQEEPEIPSASLIKLLEQLHERNLLATKEVEEALRLKALSDFDTYLFDYSGEAQFLSCPPIDIPVSVAGFKIEDLLAQAKERHAWWQKLQTSIPSMENVPVLNKEAVNSSNLTVEQKQRLQTLLSSGNTLNEIAFGLAQDSLNVAKFFAKLISEGLVNICSFTATSVSEIFVVDDSPILLKQFENLATNWGYSVRLFEEPTVALQTLAYSKPMAIFLDINMPGMTGFDLVKQIRRKPELATVPLIMLTAEKTLSNNWRARWSGCQFLSKPVTPDEVSKFQSELRMLLAELVNLPQSS